MLTHDNWIGISTFGTLDSYAVDLMLEELKIYCELDIKLSGPQETDAD